MMSKIASALMIAAVVSLAGPVAGHAATKKRHMRKHMTSKKMTGAHKHMVKSPNRPLRGESLMRRDNM